MTAAKRFLQYLKETANLALKYEKSEDGTLIGYSNADWAGDQHDRHSTTGNIFILSGGAVSWFSKKQPVVALSIAEAEYVSRSSATQEAVWLGRLLRDLNVCPTKPTVLREDNQGAIAIARNPISHSHTKQKYHYIREAIESEDIDLEYCPTEMMVADILMKPLPSQRFETLRKEMGLESP